MRFEFVELPHQRAEGFKVALAKTQQLGARAIVVGAVRDPATGALFARNATPTSVAVSPFSPDELVVALWVTSQVVRVDAQTGEVTPFLTGVQLPQHLLADGDTLLVGGFAAGTVYRVSATN